MTAPVSAESFAGLSFTCDLIQRREAHSCELQGLSGLCFICHLCKIFSWHQSFSQLIYKFLKIRNHVLCLFCKPRYAARTGDVDKMLLHWLCCLPSVCVRVCACVCVCVCVCVLVPQSGPTLCDPMDYHLSGSSVHGILQQEYWRGLPFPSPGDLPDPGIEPGCHLYILSKFPSLLQASVYLCEKKGMISFED